MWEMVKNKKENEAGGVIKEILKGQAKKLYAAASNQQEAIKRIGEAVRAIENVKVIGIEGIPGGQWYVIEMKDKKDVAKVLEQKVMFDERTRTLVVFRKIEVKAKKERVIEIKDLKREKEYKETKKQLEEMGVRILEENPTEKEWTTMYKERVIWKVEGKEETWTVPTEVDMGFGRKVRIAPAPICTFCHSDDHHQSQCPWKKLVA
jgi:hypothetical protein